MELEQIKTSKKRSSTLGGLESSDATFKISGKVAEKNVLSASKTFWSPRNCQAGSFGGQKSTAAKGAGALLLAAIQSDQVGGDEVGGIQRIRRPLHQDGGRMAFGGAGNVGFAR